jgi:hypothetical protein
VSQSVWRYREAPARWTEAGEASVTVLAIGQVAEEVSLKLSFPMLALALAVGLPSVASAQSTTPTEFLQARRYGPTAGEVAPDFTLRLLGQQDTVRLGDLVGERPVVLVFGSWT